MPMTLVDEAVLTKLRDEVVTPDLVDDVLARVRELVEADSRPSTLRDRLVDELAGVDRQLENLVEAIALGGQLPALVARVQETDTRRQELAQRLRMIGEGPVVPCIDWRATERQARQLLADWRAVLVRRPQRRAWFCASCSPASRSGSRRSTNRRAAVIASQGQL